MEDDLQNVADALVRIVAKLSEDVLQLQEEEPGDAASAEQLGDHPSEHVRLGRDSRAMSRPLDGQPAADSSSNLEETGTESVEDNTHTDGVLQDDQRDNVGGTSEEMEDGALIVG